MMALLQEAWRLCPDLRLGQLLTVVSAMDVEPPQPVPIFFIEDSDMTTRIESFIVEIKNETNGDLSNQALARKR